MASKRQVIFDTETTGFDPYTGDRLIEIGCLAMENMILNGEKLHYYVNPEDKMVGEGAFQVHGLSNEFLADKPLFSDIAQDLIDFIGESELVAHNADFDMKFINWELENAGYKPYPATRFVDTLAIARSKFPGAQNSLDALCRRFEIDNSHRTLHGALLDSEILAEVYIELMGGKQVGLDLSVNKAGGAAAARVRKERPHRTFSVPQAELAAHQDFVKKLKDPIWLKGD